MKDICALAVIFFAFHQNARSLYLLLRPIQAELVADFWVTACAYKYTDEIKIRARESDFFQLKTFVKPLLLVFRGRGRTRDPSTTIMSLLNILIRHTMWWEMLTWSSGGIVMTRSKNLLPPLANSIGWTVESRAAVAMTTTPGCRQVSLHNTERL